MLVTERLDVSHNFVTIDSPIKFFLEINGDVKTRVLKSSQAIQIDCRKLLTKKDMPNFPAWTLSLIYDDSLLAPGEKVNWYPHDVDFAGSQDSVNGQLVDVDLSALYAELSANNQALVTSVDVVKSSVDAVKSSVDALRYLDLGSDTHVVGEDYFRLWKSLFTPTPDVLDNIARSFRAARESYFMFRIADAGSGNNPVQYNVRIPSGQIFWVGLHYVDGFRCGLDLHFRGAKADVRDTSGSTYYPCFFDTPSVSNDRLMLSCTYGY